MTRQELRSYIKKKFKALGFQADRKYFYKIYDNDYLVGFYLNPDSCSKGYMFNCGIIFLPDDEFFPLTGYFDYPKQFFFPFDLNIPIDYSAYPDRRKIGPSILLFEYEKYTLEQLEYYFSKNYDIFIKPFENKDYVYDLYRKDWRLMRHFEPQKVAMICERANLDKKDVFDFLGLNLSELNQEDFFLS